jgi:hypothetical protein
MGWKMEMESTKEIKEIYNTSYNCGGLKDIQFFQLQSLLSVCASTKSQIIVQYYNAISKIP